MGTNPIEVDSRQGRHARFEVTAPRRFLLPAILLLIAEQPRHGYGLAKEIQLLRLGRVDRPSVYRALAQLEGDGLVMSLVDAPRDGQARRSYRITAEGEFVLRQWMAVIKDERDGLDRVLRRYLTTESLDAMLAEVAGGWQSVAPPMSAVSPSGPVDGRFGRVRRGAGSSSPMAVYPSADEIFGIPPDDDIGSEISHFDIVPDRSVVLIDARSSVGPITFGAIGLTGTIDVKTSGGRIDAEAMPSAHLEVDVDSLHSGNSLYDAELMRRLEGRRYPKVCVDLRQSRAAGSEGRYRVQGDVSCHGTTAALDGSVELSLLREDMLVVRGEQTVDIRDFGVASPTALMLRIYPDVIVKIQIEAEMSQSAG